MRGLSPRTQRRRFHGRLPALGVAALTSHADVATGAHNQRQQALVVTVKERGQDRLVADARFV